MDCSHPESVRPRFSGSVLLYPRCRLHGFAVHAGGNSIGGSAFGLSANQPKDTDGTAAEVRSFGDKVLLITGGGTCLDIAKTIAFGVKQTGDIWEYLTYAKEPDTTEHLPVGTIITFPSSGSDLNGSTQITAFVQLSLGYIGLGRSEIAESLSPTSSPSQ